MNRICDWFGAVRLAVALLCFVLQLTSPAHAQEAQWIRLTQEAAELNRKALYRQAQVVALQAVEVAERTFGPDHPKVAASLNNLAELYRKQGQYAQAEPFYKRSLAIKERALGPDNSEVAIGLGNLALLKRIQGQYAQAEPLYKRALAIQEVALGPDHPDLATTLNSLAELYRHQGQYAQAEPLHKRALAIRETALGQDHPSVAQSLNNLAILHHIQDQHAQAEPLYKRSLAIKEKVLVPDHPDVTTSLRGLATLYFDQGKYEQAEPLYIRALAIRERTLGPEHPDVSASLSSLAGLYRKQGNYTQVEPLYKRSLAILEKTFGSEHPDVAAMLTILAGLFRTQGQYMQALDLSRKASNIYRNRIVVVGGGDTAAREAAKNLSGFANHLSLLSRNPNSEPPAKLTDESLQVVQLTQASGTASAIAKMAARFAKGDDAMAGLIKRKQDASESRKRGETQIVSAASKPPKERVAEVEQRLRDDIAAAGKEIATIDAELTRRFPEYQELTRPEPATVKQVQGLLKSGEAMLVYSLGSSSFIWVVKSDSAEFRPLKADAKDIAAKVAKIRSEMEFDAAGRLGRVSVDVLHELHQSLIAPVLPSLAGVKHLMVVPSGALQSLPFSMLVASPPPEIKTNADYRQVDWLAKRYALSVLPSVSSIQAFRLFAKASTAPEPFAGIGDPVIGVADGATRGARGKTSIATVFRNTPKGSTLATEANEIADVDAIRNAPRLPETADELRAMAKALKATEKSLWLQANATEAKIKQLDLSSYRTIAIATHGVMAGEIEGVGEPGLILTPPPTGTVEDDGYLSASEIAKLRLNADWVVLSACNTAAADGTPGAEGLSGLAKAFFYAGARSLLVSHWPVASEATVPLTTAMLKEYEANPAQGKAEAHRKAMLALMESPGNPQYAHPLFWAPFVVVGEGGAGKAHTSAR